MESAPFQPVPLTSILDYIAGLSEEAFHTLKEGVGGPNVYDSEPERVTNLAAAMGAEVEATRLTLDTLYYLYVQIHKSDLGSESLQDILATFLSTINDQDDSADTESLVTDYSGFIVNRLEVLLKKTSNSVGYDKYLKLVNGPLPTAVNFLPILDLRPIFYDNSMLDELIPLIQMRVRMHPGSSNAPDIVFQMDRRGLNRLREAINEAYSLINTIEDRSDVGHLLTKRRL